MKYIISENKIINLVGKLIKMKYPNFNKENSLQTTWSNGDESYIEFYDPKIKGGKGIFAKYWIWKEELQLNHVLFEFLENHLGEDVTYVLDWFNQEFDKDAQSITF